VEKIPFAKESRSDDIGHCLEETEIYLRCTTLVVIAAVLASQKLDDSPQLSRVKDEASGEGGIFVETYWKSWIYKVSRDIFLPSRVFISQFTA
jgi:hypothetical protein